MSATSADDVQAAVASSPPPLRVRRVSFAQSLEELPRYFAGDGDLVTSHALAALSAVFPDGEDFFVRSVRHFRSEVTDPQLRKDVGAFIGQEAVHGREHRELNDRLDRLGYPAKRIERFTKKGLGLRERIMSPHANLAGTAALEHFTATLAEIILSSEDARRQIGAESVLDVLLWPALEESEHKAVAFDVYRAVGGSERTRRRLMNLTFVTFLGGMSVQVLISVLRDREFYRRGQLRAAVRSIGSSAFFTRDAWRKLRDYNRADFHPDDHDTTELLAEWQERLFGADGRLNDRLVNAA